MNDAFMNWAAEKYLADLRDGSLPLDLLEAGVRWPFVDDLRKHVKPEDQSLVFRLLSSKNESESWLGHVLARKILKVEGTQERLSALYDSSDSTVLKLGLIYDLLEFEDVAQQRRAEFLEYVEKHRNEFARGLLRWHTDDKSILDGVRDRVLNPDSFNPANPYKVWIYVYELSFVREEKEEARRLIQSIAKTADEFTKKIIDLTLSKL